MPFTPKKDAPYPVQPFIAQRPGDCGFCGEELLGTSTTYASKDSTLVHAGRCHILYNTGVKTRANTP